MSDLYREPAQDVLILGEMIRDGKIIADILKSLPLSGEDNYRGELRVVAGAALRIRERSMRLLGDLSTNIDGPNDRPQSLTKPRNPPERKRAGRTNGARSPEVLPPIPDDPTHPTARIIEAIRKAPRSSGELIEFLKLEPQKVYQTTSQLKASGRIETREVDGERRWFLR